MAGTSSLDSGSPDGDANSAQESAPAQPGMSAVVHRNIRALTEVRRREDERQTPGDRIAGAIAAFGGSHWSVVIHALFFGGWLTINVGVLPLAEPWDPFPFVMLAMIASVEAIFLSTFILINQNRMTRLADRRAELDLQISLLTEHELTRAIKLIDAVAQHLGAAGPPDREMQEIKKDVNPEKVVEEIRKAEEHVEQNPRDKYEP